MSRRPSLESATLVTLFLTVVAVAGSSSWSTGLRDVVQPFRTAGLVALCGLGIAYALRNDSLPQLSVPFVLATGFLALAAASIAWSVDPRHTLVRGGAFGLVLVAAQAIGVGVRGRGRAARRFLVALL